MGLHICTIHIGLLQNCTCVTSRRQGIGSGAGAAAGAMVPNPGAKSPEQFCRRIVPPRVARFQFGSLIGGRSSESQLKVFSLRIRYPVSAPTKGRPLTAWPGMNASCHSHHTNAAPVGGPVADGGDLRTTSPKPLDRSSLSRMVVSRVTTISYAQDELPEAASFCLQEVVTWQRLTSISYWLQKATGIAPKCNVGNYLQRICRGNFGLGPRQRFQRPAKTRDFAAGDCRGVRPWKRPPKRLGWQRMRWAAPAYA